MAENEISAIETDNKYVYAKSKTVSDGNLGVGAFSSVHLVKSKSEHRLYAAKAAKNLHKKNEKENSNSLVSYENEKKIFKEIEKHRGEDKSSDFICRYYEEGMNSHSTYLIMEYADNGNITNLLKERGKLTDYEVRHYACQILLGLYFLHRNNIVHCDLKPDNILLTSKNQIRICDFGMSINQNITNNKIMGSTLEYSPPELVGEGANETEASGKIDVWSFGVIVFFLYTGKNPFRKENNEKVTKAKIMSMSLGKSAKELPDQALIFLEKIFKKTEERPTALKLLNDEYFDKGKSIPLNLNYTENLNFDDSLVEEDIRKETEEDIRMRKNKFMTDYWKDIPEKEEEESLEKISENSKSSESSSSSNSSKKEARSLKNNRRISIDTSGSLSKKAANINAMVSNIALSPIQKDSPLNKALDWDSNTSLGNALEKKETEKAIKSDNSKGVSSSEDSGVYKPKNSSDEKEEGSLGVLCGITSSSGESSPASLGDSGYKKFSFKGLKFLEKFEQSTEDKIVVKKYYDYSNKFGIAYLLSDDSVGLSFNDGSKLVLPVSTNNFRYVNEYGQKSVGSIKEPPNEVKEKVDILIKLVNFFSKTFYVFPEIKDTPPRAGERNFIYVTKYKKYEGAFCLQLNNENIQVVFDDGVELIDYHRMKLSFYIGGNKEAIQINEKSIKNHNVLRRLRYANKILFNLEI